MSHVSLLLLSCSEVLRWLRRSLLHRSLWCQSRSLPNGLCLDGRNPTIERGRCAYYSIVGLLRDLRPDGLNRLLCSSHLMRILLDDCLLRLNWYLSRAGNSWQRILGDRGFRLCDMSGLRESQVLGVRQVTLVCGLWLHQHWFLSRWLLVIA